MWLIPRHLVLGIFWDTWIFRLVHGTSSLRGRRGKGWWFGLPTDLGRFDTWMHQTKGVFARGISEVSEGTSMERQGGYTRMGFPLSSSVAMIRSLRLPTAVSVTWVLLFHFGSQIWDETWSCFNKDKDSVLVKSRFGEEGLLGNLC